MTHESLAWCNLADPWLALDELDRVHYARNQASGIAVSRSDDAGRSWGSVVNVHDQPDTADKGSIHSDGNGTIYVLRLKEWSPDER